MAFADLAPTARPTAAPSPAALFRKLRTGLAAWRAERARRVALSDLLDMPAHRLRDLGLDAGDIRQALYR